VVILTIFHLVMKQTLSIAEAKARFADVIKHTEHEPVVVTRDGTPVAVVVNIADYEDLRKTRAARQAGGLASIAGGGPDRRSWRTTSSGFSGSGACREGCPGARDVAFLFDTDAISEVFKPRPDPAHIAWLSGVPQTEQCTSAVVVGELFAGAMRRGAARRHVKNLRERVLPLVRVIPFDATTAEIYGRLRSELEDAGLPVADLDLQIGATAIASPSSREMCATTSACPGWS
jgi:prevent-host-death family protein